MNDKTHAIRCATVLAILVAFSSCCDEGAVPKRIQGLYSADAKVRNDSALAIARCGSAGAPAVSRLADLMYDKNVGVQSAAAYALRKIDTKEARHYLTVAEDRREQRRKAR